VETLPGKIIAEENALMTAEGFVKIVLELIQKENPQCKRKKGGQI